MAKIPTKASLSQETEQKLRKEKLGLVGRI